jgi:hypothetical protein
MRGEGRREWGGSERGGKRKEQAGYYVKVWAREKAEGEKGFMCGGGREWIERGVATEGDEGEYEGKAEEYGREGTSREGKNEENEGKSSERRAAGMERGEGERTGGRA